MGFTGKQIIHPNQVPICQEAFSPSLEKIEWARELIQGFEKHQKSGKVFHHKNSPALDSLFDDLWFAKIN